MSSRRAAAQYAGNIALWTIATAAVLMFLQAARSLMIPIALGVLISYALAPLSAWLEKSGVPGFVAAAIVLMLAIGVCGGVAYTLRDDVSALAAQVPKAMQRTTQFLHEALGPGGQAIEKAGALEQPADVATQAGLLNRTVSATAAFAGNLVVIVFLIYFLLISRHDVRNRLVAIAGAEPERRQMTATIIDEVNTHIQRYLLVLLVTGAIVGIATWIVLAWMRVPQAAMWGLLAGLLNSVPYFGPVLVTGGLLVVGIVQGGVVHAIEMAGASLAITSVEGWLLTPALMGKAERMSALAVFLGLLLWTWVWGAWGTVLAVPMLVVIKSVSDHVPPLKPLGSLMAP